MFPINAFQSTLMKVVEILESFGIRFHLTGGITSVAYGEPRMTQDIDIVIDNTMARARVEPLIERLSKSDFMFDEVSVRRAIDAKQMFQLLDRIEILKLDIYPREMIPGELERSVSLEIFDGQFLPVASRADAATSKLIWVSKGSHKSRRDFRQIWQSASDQDRDLILHLTNELELGALCQEVLAEADELAE